MEYADIPAIATDILAKINDNNTHDITPAELRKILTGITEFLAIESQGIAGTFNEFSVTEIVIPDGAVFAGIYIKNETVDPLIFFIGSTSGDNDYLEETPISAGFDDATTKYIFGPTSLFITCSAGAGVYKLFK